MPEAKQDQGDPELHALFEEFEGKLTSPGGAAQLLGVSRKTIYTLGQRGVIRVFHSSKKHRASETGRRWAFIPLEDLQGCRQSSKRFSS
jgi:hypothetical protein